MFVKIEYKIMFFISNQRNAFLFYFFFIKRMESSLPSQEIHGLTMAMLLLFTTNVGKTAKCADSLGRRLTKFTNDSFSRTLKPYLQHKYGIELSRVLLCRTITQFESFSVLSVISKRRRKKLNAIYNNDIFRD